jgi:DNA-binding protein YbaB
MITQLDNLIQETLDELRSTQTRLAAARRKLHGTTSKASSPDRMVTVTVDAKGEVAAITFNTQKFRKMAPAELGSVLVETIREARQESRERVSSTFQPFFPQGTSVTDILTGKVNLDRIFDDAVHRAGELVPAQREVRGADPVPEKG